MNDALLYKNLIDVRSESDFNLFHLQDAWHVGPDDLENPDVIRRLLESPANTVNVIMSNDEQQAVVAYKTLRAQNVLNVYILSGGINNWLDTFTIDKSIALPPAGREKKNDDTLRYTFSRAVGETLYPANPRISHGHALPALKFEKKVKMKKKKTISGGCG
jgi:rhodanese-related sulfurtransferase